MKVSLTRDNDVPLHFQLKEQLRMLILSGELSAGSRLPSSRQIAAVLKVNRNTVYRALHDLEQDGLVTSNQGQGTFVTGVLAAHGGRDTARLIEVVSGALAQAAAAGFTPDEFISTAVGLANSGSPRLARPQVVVVECNATAAQHYVEALTSELRVDAEAVLLSQLRAADAVELARLRDSDLIVTTAGHLPEVRRLLHDPHHLYGLGIGPLFEVVRQALATSSDATVGIICMTVEGAAGLKQILADAGVDQQQMLCAGLDQPDSVATTIERADSLIVSTAAQEVVRNMAGSRLPIAEYKNVLGATGLAVVRSALARRRSIVTELEFAA